MSASGRGTVWTSLAQSTEPQKVALKDQACSENLVLGIA
jgi:hypothetical protein